MNLKDFFEENRRAAIAFSGGVDSAYLIYAAQKYGAEVKAYYVKSAFQPEFEWRDALRLSTELNVEMKVLPVNILENCDVASNPYNRCYYCKKALFYEITKAALEDGFSLILDGTNASDEESDRPGMQAIRELKVCSPLRECGLTKKEIRKLSKEAGLFTWNKPAYACLATRIPTGCEITKEKLFKTEQAEAALFRLGFTDFRVRMLGNMAKLQVPADQFEKVFNEKENIIAELKKHYSSILLDLEERG